MRPRAAAAGAPRTESPLPCGARRRPGAAEPGASDENPASATDLGAGPLFGEGMWVAKLDATSQVSWTRALPEGSVVSLAPDAAVAAAQIDETALVGQVISASGTVEMKVTGPLPEACDRSRRVASTAITTDRVHVLLSCRKIDNDFYGTTSGPTTTVIASLGR